MVKFDDWFENANEVTQLELFLCVTALKLAETKDDALYFKDRIASILEENGVEFEDNINENNICKIKKQLGAAK